MVLGDHIFDLPKSAPEDVPKGDFGEGKSVGRNCKDLLLGDNSLVSTEIVHEVGGDSAEVNGQEIPVIVGVGSLLGKAFIALRTRRVPAT